MDNSIEYMDLLSKNYAEALDLLLQKYGPVQDDYFREASYYRFMKGEIKSISKGKFTRTSEGLYCHHIDEIKWLKISDKDYVKKFNIPFETQRKDRLVYCDLIEHTILHVLITKETSFKYGYPGYGVYLKPIIEEWYLDEVKPNPEWMKKCYIKSFLTPQKAFNLLREMQKILEENYFNTLNDYYNEKRKKEEDRKKLEEQIKQRKIDDRNNWIERAKQLHYKSSRMDIVMASYNVLIYYKNITTFRGSFVTFKDYDNKMKVYPKEKILDDLLIYIESLHDVNNGVKILNNNVLKIPKING